MSFKERVYWNSKSYGSRLKIKRSTLLIILVAICLLTPFTNWIIPFLHKIVSSDLFIEIPKNMNLWGGK